jgi:GTPase Era involved in 16S rRNA processing
MSHHSSDSFPETEFKTSKQPTSSALHSLLSQSKERVAHLGDEFSTDLQNLENLQQRLADERFHLAVLGQFKRGKSTLLNALLGEELLPTSVVPVTAIPTFLLPGPRLEAQVYFLDQRPPRQIQGSFSGELNSLLAEFVSEESNPKNRLRVSQVEVFHPSPLLEGLVLIDTPGIGSTFRHNTETTRNFLSQCDAALFLISADPPLTEVEIDFLKQVRMRVPRLFFVLNKVDYLTSQDVERVERFLKEVLRKQAGIEEELSIFCVSARQGLEARMLGDTTLWEQSGMQKVETHLIHFMANEKAKALQEAVAIKARNLLEDVILRLQVMLHSLRMPLTQLDERMEIFEHKLQEAEQQRLVASDLLTGDRKRLESLLEEQAEALRQKSRSFLQGIVRQHVAGAVNGTNSEGEIRETMAAGIPGFFERELGEVSRSFGLRVSKGFKPHQQRANELIEAMRRTEAELFDAPYRAQDQSISIPMSRQPYWVEREWDSTAAPIPAGAFDRLLPAILRKARIEKRLLQQAGALVRHNVENLRWATLQNLDLAFRRLSASIDERLEETILSIRKAIQKARAKRQEQTESVESEILRLEAELKHLEEMKEQFSGNVRP